MLIVRAQSDLITAPLDIKVTELKPHCNIVITAETRDASQRKWLSHAKFRSNADGEVDLATQMPISGSYYDADVTGLFWSMRPVASPQLDTCFMSPSLTEYTVTLKIYQSGKLIVKHDLLRKIAIDGVRSELIESQDFIGKLFLPPGDGPFPGVVLCGGSSGGLASQERNAAILASSGFATLIVAYYKYPGLPQEFYEVPIDPVVKAIAWLNQHSQIKAECIGLMGISKGSEIASLAAIASQSKHLKAMLLLAPSMFVWQGFGTANIEAKPSWSYEGRPAPYARVASLKILPQILLNAVIRKLKLTKKFQSLLPFKLLPMFGGLRRHVQKSHDALIPIEDVTVPVCMIAGAKDCVWPAASMAETMHLVRGQNGHDNDALYIYPYAGHVLPLPYAPTTITWSLEADGSFGMKFGGSPKANAHAAVDIWQKIINFFNTHL